MKITNKRQDAKLSNIIPFVEDGRWYLKLVYKYEDEKGKHTVVIPKVSLPFDQGHVPNIVSVPSYCDVICDRPYIEFLREMVLYKGTCSLAIERGLKDPAYYFDVITEPAYREMTLDEIEKKLGYKVKIINKEETLSKEEK